jgi:hypothetical protein
MIITPHIVKRYTAIGFSAQDMVSEFQMMHRTSLETLADHLASHCCKGRGQGSARDLNFYWTHETHDVMTYSFMYGGGGFSSSQAHYWPDCFYVSVVDEATRTCFTSRCSSVANVSNPDSRALHEVTLHDVTLHDVTKVVQQLEHASFALHQKLVHLHNNNGNNGPICSLCMLVVDLGTTVSTDCCNNIFHVGCLHDWCDECDKKGEGQVTACPMCRAALKF